MWTLDIQGEDIQERPFFLGTAAILAVTCWWEHLQFAAQEASSALPPLPCKNPATNVSAVLTEQDQVIRELQNSHPWLLWFSWVTVSSKVVVWEFFSPECFEGQEWLGKSQIFCSPQCLFVATCLTSENYWVKIELMAIVEDIFEFFSPLSILGTHLLLRYSDSNWIDSFSKGRRAKKLPFWLCHQKYP